MSQELLAMPIDPNRPASKNLKPFKPGQSGNPGGKAVGARTKLQGKFLHALADDFEAHGVKAIKDMREQDPGRYVQVVAALMPKQVEETKPLDEINDEQLAAAIAILREQIARNAGAGEAETGIVPTH
jgi:hypothetical protein